MAGRHAGFGRVVTQRVVPMRVGTVRTVAGVRVLTMSVMVSILRAKRGSGR